MEDLERAFEAIRAVRDCPSVARLILDVWVYAQANGESNGLRLAAVLLVGAREYQRHENATKNYGRFNKESSP